jgi:hypothetical protein
MTKTLQEPSIPGSAKVQAQHTRNPQARTPREEGGKGTGAARKDTTTMQEKNPHPGTQRRS